MNKQYMLNNSLIIVPVPEEENAVCFSLPKGVWTDFHTGKEYLGGEWTAKKPSSSDSIIMVRENSVIIENTDTGCELRVYALCDGIRIDADVYADATELELSVSFKRNGRSIHVASDGAIPYTVRMINMYAKSAANGLVLIDGNDSVITPDAWACTMEIVF